MEKIKSDRSVSFPAVHLCKDELDKILEILNEVSDDVEIRDKDYSYDSLDELKSQKGLYIDNMGIRSSNPYLNLSFNKKDFSCIYLYASDSREAIYAFTKIEEVLNSRRSLLSFAFGSTVGYYIPLVTIGLFYFLSFPENTLLIPMEAFVPISSLILLLPGVTYLVRSGKLFSICLEKRHERSNFFARQKDDLLKIILGAVAGAILTYLIK